MVVQCTDEHEKDNCRVALLLRNLNTYAFRLAFIDPEELCLVRRSVA